MNLPKTQKNAFNPFQPSVAFHVETSHLFCFAKQVTGFYMKCNTGLTFVNPFRANALQYSAVNLAKTIGINGILVQNRLKLSHFSPMFHFCPPPLKRSENLSGGTEKEHWAKMG